MLLFKTSQPNSGKRIIRELDEAIDTSKDRCLFQWAVCRDSQRGMTVNKIIKNYADMSDSDNKNIAESLLKIKDNIHNTICQADFFNIKSDSSNPDHYFSFSGEFWVSESTGVIDWRIEVEMLTDLHCATFMETLMSRDIIFDYLINQGYKDLYKESK